MRINLFFLFLCLIFASCDKQQKAEKVKPSNEVFLALDVPAITIDKSKLNFDKNTSRWTLDGQFFSGYAVSYFQDSTQKQKFGILDGKKQNEAFDWFADGHLKHSANYYKGKLQGEKKTWAAGSTHILISKLNYHAGKVHGIQKKWYSTGEIFKILHLNMGKEEGIQQAFRKNGDLFANYEAREGRIFGLKRASLCYAHDDEIVQHEN